VGCSELQRVAVCCSQFSTVSTFLSFITLCCSGLQRVVERCSVLQSILRQFSTVSTFLSFITQCTINNIQLHTGWKRCIECLKLRVSFRKSATIYRVLLQKMTYKTSYEASPPCTIPIWYSSNMVCVCVCGRVFIQGIE